MSAGPYSYDLIDPPFSIDTGPYRNVNVMQVNDLGQVLGTIYGGAVNHPFLYFHGDYTNLDVPGAASTTAIQLNNAGQILGRYSDAIGSHSFLYQDGSYSEISVPGAPFTTALQISAAGKILAEYFDSSGLHPFIDDNGTYTTLSVPGATSTIVQTSYGGAGSSPLIINDRDQVIGTYIDADGSHAFLYSDGSYTTLAVPGAISTAATQLNNAGQVLGTYSSPSGTRSFLYSDGIYTSLAVPGTTNTTAYQINDAGQIAGTYFDATGSHVFLDSSGTYVTIAPPSSGSSAPSSASFIQLSNAGDVLGSYYNPSSAPFGGSQPFLYSDGTSTDVGVPGAVTTNAIRFNDHGQLIGSFSDGVTNHAFLATAISTDVMQAVSTADLLPAVPDASAFLAVTSDSTNLGASLLGSAGDNAGPDPRLGLLDDRGTFGL